MANDQADLVYVQNFIDGLYSDPDDKRYVDSFDPSTGKVWAKIPDSGLSDVERAVLAAQKAFDGSVLVSL